jgi:hypothetical protein
MHWNLTTGVDVGNAPDTSFPTKDGFCVIMELTKEEKQELLRMWSERGNFTD